MARHIISGIPEIVGAATSAGNNARAKALSVVKPQEKGNDGTRRRHLAVIEKDGGVTLEGTIEEMPAAHVAHCGEAISVNVPAAGFLATIRRATAALVMANVRIVRIAHKIPKRAQESIALLDGDGRPVSQALLRRVPVPVVRPTNDVRFTQATTIVWAGKDDPRLTRRRGRVANLPNLNSP